MGLCVCNSMGEGKPALASPMNKQRMNDTRASSMAPGSPTSPGSPLGSPVGQLTAAPTQNDLSRKMIVGTKQLVAESEYTSLSEGSLLLCMEEGAEYVVVPSTFNPDIFGHFALKFISSSPVLSHWLYEGTVSQTELCAGESQRHEPRNKCSAGVQMGRQKLYLWRQPSE